MVLAMLCAAGTVLATGSAWAQDGGGDRLFRIDAEVVYGTVGLAWPVGRAWSVGGELGGGVSRLIHTVAGDDAGEDLEFAPILHAGVFLDRPLTGASALELGVRGGVGDILESPCPASDCWPQGFVSAHAGLDLGGDTFRAATRLAVIRQEGEALLVWTPVFLRVRL